MIDTSGKQARKSFLQQLKGCKIRQPDDYLSMFTGAESADAHGQVGNGNSKLFESTTVFALNAFDFTTSAVRLLNETVSLKLRTSALTQNADNSCDP